MELALSDGYPRTRIFLVRHGQTEYNFNRIMQGRRINSSLNEMGRSQAASLAERFKETPIDALYASSLQRAVDTAAAIAERQPEPLAVRCRSAFDEMCWGRFEGMGSSPELQNILDRVYSEWDNGNFGYLIENGESILDVQKRAVEGFHEVLAYHPGETVVIASHGRLLRVLLATLLPEYGLPRMHEIHHHNTCVNELIIDEGTCRAIRLNCVRHLSTYQMAA